MTKLNKRLSILLAGLIVLYVLALAFHSAGRESNIQAKVFHIDTAGVTEVDMYPRRAGREEIKILRQGGRWQVRSGSVEASPVGGSVAAALGALVDVPARRLVSRRKDRWDDYKVGDTTGSRVVLYKGKEVVGDYFVGAGDDGGSYLRQNGHEEVYAVDGYLEGMIDKSFADWRDRSFLRLNKEEVVSIQFQGAGGLTLTKKDSSWYIGSARVATDSVNRYLGGLTGFDLTDFADGFTASGSPERSIGFEGKAGPLAIVNAWRKPGGGWVVNSSQNAESYFSISDSVMERDLWRDAARWAR